MSDSIKVAIKVRPLIKREKEENLSIQWAVNGNFIAPLDPDFKKRGEGGFSFDHIFDMGQTNSDVFNVVVKPIVEGAVNGFNGTIFAYGQTSSGKTYTMMGTKEEPGVVPLAVEYMFDTIANTYGREFLLRVSYIEIYNERINDLLDKNNVDLKIKEDSKGQVIINYREEVINSPASVLAIMKKGDKNRRIEETNMNERSSRSHSIFRITIESHETRDGPDGVVHISQLNLVDLAGSERARQTGATGERFNEGRHINLSLSSLGLVIMQLSESQENPQKYVNFRDSKLTRILQTSLGGNAMTTIICAVTPAALEETQCTLAFASRAKSVKNKPRVNEEMSDGALLKRYAKQLAKLNAELERMKQDARSAEVVAMESKLLEKDRTNQLLEERIELLKTRIVCGSNMPEDTAQRRARRRRTWGGPDNYQIGFHLPTIKELENTPEKQKMQEHKKRRQSIIQSVDIANQTFQTAFTDFELELIESERERDQNRLSDCSTHTDDEYFITKRSHYNRVQFMDDVAILGSNDNSANTTPEKKTSSPKQEDPESPGTPKVVLRSRLNFLIEEFNNMSQDHRALTEFTTLEKQMFVDNAVEIATIQQREMIETLQKSLADSENMCREINEKYSTLQIHSMESDNRLVELEEKIAESANSLKVLESEKQALIDELNKMKEVKQPVVEPRNNSEKEISSIFANASYFENMEVSEVDSDSVFMNDTENSKDISTCDTSTANTTLIKLDDSKKSKELTNAAYSEFMKEIGEKTSDELARVMQELINTKLSLEDENAKLEATLQFKVREADDIKNDIRELKSGIEKLEKTIYILTTENTDLTSKLTAEKENAKIAIKDLQANIAEISTNLHAVTEEKTLLEKNVEQLKEQLKTLNESKSATEVNETTKDLIKNLEETINSLNSENIELSSNLMNKIEELDRMKDQNAPPGEHECVYRELLVNLSDRNKLLEAENIELSNNLMDKIEECDRAKKDLEFLSSKAESKNIVEISMNCSNSSDDATPKNRCSNTEIVTNGTHHELNVMNNEMFNASQLTKPVVKNLLDLSITDNIIIEENGVSQQSNGQLQIEKTVDDLLQMTIAENRLIEESKENQKSSDDNVEALKIKVALLQEQVESLTLLNNKLSDLKLTSCIECAHLTERNEIRRILKIQVKTLTQKLQELETKFERECADTKVLRTKASEDLNFSTSDLTMNGSMLECGVNVSFIEEKVQMLNNELEALKENHDKLSNLYKEKCEEIEKLHDGSILESSSMLTESPRSKRSDDKLDKIQLDMEKLRTDLRHCKKRIVGISSSMHKFINEKLSMQSEIDLLKTEKEMYEEKLSETENSRAETQSKIESLEKEIAALNNDLDTSNRAKQELEDVKISLETELQSLRAEKKQLEENLVKSENMTVSDEDNTQSEKEIANLNNEKSDESMLVIPKSENLESLKLNVSEQEKNLTDLLESLRKYENDNSMLKAELVKITAEKDQLIDSRLMDDCKAIESMIDSNKYEEENAELKVQLTKAKEIEITLSADNTKQESEIAALKAERLNLETTLNNLRETLREFQENNGALIIASEAMESQLEDVSDSLKNCLKEKAELHEKFNEVKISEMRLTDVKLTLENEIINLKADITNLQEDLKNVRCNLRDIEENNSMLKTELENVKTEKENTMESVIGETEEKAFKQYEKMAEELRTKLEKITSDLRTNAEYTTELNNELTKLTAAKDELNNEKLALEVEVQSLKAERFDLKETVSGLQQTLLDRERHINAFNAELELKKLENENLGNQIENRECADISSTTLQEYEKTIDSLNRRVKELTAEINEYVAENDRLKNEVTELLNVQQSKGEVVSEIDDSKREDKDQTINSIDAKHQTELESARKFIMQEISALKPTTASEDLDSKSVRELFTIFVSTIMAKEEEVIKELSNRFQREKRILEDRNQQSVDSEKRLGTWVKELEAEIERTQQDLVRQESKNAELTRQITKLENVLKESTHENELLKEKMDVLEADFNTLQADLDKSPTAQNNSTLSSPEERDRLIQEALNTREMELSLRLRTVEKQHKEKVEEITNNLELYKSKNIDLTNTLEGLEANEKQLKNIIDIKSNELIKCNNIIERIQGELQQLTESYNHLNQENVDKTQRIDEITALLKNKCDKMSEYKTKLETITPEYEHLKDQATERQLRLEKYKSEIECLASENEKQMASLRDRLDSEEIKSADYRKQLVDMTNRNTVLQNELEELKRKCDELELSNAKLTKSMRNSTSKIRAEQEMEDLKDANRTLQRNLEGASNRITELQEMKTKMIRDLVELRGKYETISNDNIKLKNTIQSYKTSASNTVDLRQKYDTLLQEKNRVDLELEGKKSMMLQLEKKLEACTNENEKLNLRNKELDEEMDDIVREIHELRKENGQLSDELYSITTTSKSQEPSEAPKIQQLSIDNDRLKEKLKDYATEIESLKLQHHNLRTQFDVLLKASESLKNDNAELRDKIGSVDKADSMSSDSARSASPAIEAARVDNRRRRSRTELFNQKRSLDICETQENDPCSDQCRCEAFKQQVRDLEIKLVSKTAKISTLEMQIQSENFPYQKKCKDLEETLKAYVKMNDNLHTELKRLSLFQAEEKSLECDRCKHWKANKQDQSSQCMPESATVYFNGMTGGIVKENQKMMKLERDKATLKNLCRVRHEIIEDLQAKIKELESQKTLQSNDKSDTSSISSQCSIVNSRQAMKENIPGIRDIKKSIIRRY